MAVFDDIRSVPVDARHRMIDAGVCKLIPHREQLGFRTNRTGNIAILDIQPGCSAFTPDRVRLGSRIRPKLPLHDFLAGRAIGAVITGLGAVITVRSPLELVVITNLQFRAFPIGFGTPMAGGFAVTVVRRAMVAGETQAMEP